ncbi:hypothetical protein AMECASPLE_010994 [Ameca splendens]|uniref:Uncharacterized protein n=1 Tax=Ameca splendens TaxID=208324 RepID=A0ABV0Y0N7_9TELE
MFYTHNRMTGVWGDKDFRLCSSSLVSLAHPSSTPPPPHLHHLPPPHLHHLSPHLLWLLCSLAANPPPVSVQGEDISKSKPYKCSS